MPQGKKKFFLIKTKNWLLLILIFFLNYVYKNVLVDKFQNI